MGRLLGIAKYGDMSALFSLTILVGTLPSTLSLVLVKFISSAKTTEEVSAFLNWIYPKSFFLGSLIFGFCFIFSGVISRFLNIADPRLVWLISLLFIFNLPLIVLRAALQGLTKFTMYAVSLVLDGAFKLIFGYILVTLGFSLFGAVVGVVIASFCSWCLSHIFISPYFGTVKAHRPHLKPLFLYSLPVILNTVASASLFSSDMVLVKHFFDSESAGTYASLGTIGKMILFGTGPISGVMFPLVSKRQALGANFTKVFFGGLGLTFIIGFSAVLCFSLFSRLVIGVMFGPGFLGVVPFLPVFSLSMLLYALGFYLVGFNLSLNKTNTIFPPLVFALTQYFAISLFHSSLWQVVNISLLISTSLLISLAIYTFLGVKYTSGGREICRKLTYHLLFRRTNRKKQLRPTSGE